MWIICESVHGTQGDPKYKDCMINLDCVQSVTNQGRWANVVMRDGDMVITNLSVDSWKSALNGVVSIFDRRSGNVG